MTRAAAVRRLRRILRSGGVPARRSPRPDGRAQRLQEYNPYHGKDGKFTSKGRASQGGGLTVTSNVALAQKILYEGGRVQLDSPKTVSTLLDKLGAASMRAFEQGTQAQDFDLCKVSVKGTNLFCSQSKGIPRIKMPQLGGKPMAGTNASKLKKDKNGEVDVSAQFRQFLTKKGTRVTDERERADLLKASQNQLVGPKVAGMMAAAQAGKFDPSKKAIFISKDNYVIDGHHRWAATVGMDALQDGKLGDIKMPVIRVDMPIMDVLDAANNFTREFGIAPKAGKVQEALRRRRPTRPASAVEQAAEAALARLTEYNMNHDRLGKFARANSSRGGFGTTGNLPLDAATGLDALQRAAHPINKGDAADQVEDLDKINREDFGIGTDELVDHAAGNYFDLADAAMARGKNQVGGAMRAAKWYNRAGNLARTLARSHGLTKAKVAAVMSISSANDDWKINAKKTGQWAKAMGDKRPIPISTQQIEYAARLKHGSEWRKLVKEGNRAAKKKLGVSKLNPEQKEAVQKSVAKSSEWRAVANPTIAKWKAEGATSGKHNVDGLMKHKDGIELSVAGLSSHNSALQKGRTGLPNFRSGDMAMKTMRIYRGDDPSDVITSFKVQQKNGLFLPGMKTRQFYNNIMHNGKGRGSTQDAHMAMAALAGKRWKKGPNKGKPVVFASSGPAYGAGTRSRAYGGRYPALAEANKKARIKFNRKYKTRFSDAEFQALVWSEKKRLDSTLSPRGGRAPYNKNEKRSAWDDWREEREGRP